MSINLTHVYCTGLYAQGVGVDVNARPGHQRRQGSLLLSDSNGNRHDQAGEQGCARHNRAFEDVLVRPVIQPADRAKAIERRDAAFCRERHIGHAARARALEGGAALMDLDADLV